MNYIYGKAIRLPVTKEILDVIVDVEHFSEIITEVYPDMCLCLDVKYPNLCLYVSGGKILYIELWLEAILTDKEAEWEKWSKLSDKEIQIFAPYFRKIGIDFDDKTLMKVDYQHRTLAFNSERPNCIECDWNEFGDWSKYIESERRV